MTGWTTNQQSEAMLAWVRSEAGRDAAARLVRKYGLTDEPLDLVSIASEKITASISRRTERIPSVDTSEDATRYAYRTMSNLAIDLGRRRRNESSAIFSIAAIAPTTIGTEQTVVSQIFIEELFSAGYLSDNRCEHPLGGPARQSNFDRRHEDNYCRRGRLRSRLSNNCYYRRYDFVLNKRCRNPCQKIHPRRVDCSNR